MSLRPRFDSNDEPIVQTFEVDDLELVSGEILPSARVGYCVFGDQADAPVVLLHPALTGSPKAYVPGKRSQGDGWWSGCVGPGKFLDTQRFRVVCMDHLGGNGASTGAEEIPDDLHIGFADTIRLAVRFLKAHDVDRLYAVVGGSIGGGQALAWLFQDTIAVDRIFDVCWPVARL